ncbi:hypothetical protein CLV92_110138 [Kineococcus xinjiangensis]|uniref:Uncharacterized protein n=1 Tax=Kineococcus xinjiangensis TaxID=512762 RepID=A0A2S6IH56_9ACTN|nr:hypothetical protein CLV92_110138 [Kineococcus xinjiangensis]
MAASAAERVETPLTHVLNAGWAWAGLMVLAGWIARAHLPAVAAAILSAVAAVLAFYAAEAVLLDRPFTSSAGEVEHWLVAIAVTGPGLGLVGALTRSPTLLGLLAGAVVPVGALVELALLPRWVPAGGGTHAQVAAVAACAAAVLSLGVLGWTWPRRRGVATAAPEPTGPAPVRHLPVAVALTAAAAGLVVHVLLPELT